MRDEARTPPQVLIASSDPVMAQLAARLRSEGVELRNVVTIAQAVHFADSAQECVALLDADLPRDVAFEIYKLLHGTKPIPTLILVPSEGHPDFAPDPYRAPQDEYVTRPISPDDLALRLHALMQRAGYITTAPPQATAPAPVAVAPAAPAEVVDLDDDPKQGKIIAVFAAKGGVGKSTVAVNTAVALSRYYSAKTLLVDADLYFGDIGVLMNFNSNQSLYDAWTGDEVDFMRLSKVPVMHESGVAVMLRPPDPSMAERLDATAVITAIKALSTRFDYVVIDTHSSLDELTLQVLDLADQILVVTTPEVSAGHNTLRFLKIADVVGYGGKVRLVLNRANSGVRIEALEQQLEMQVDASIVSAGRIVVESANHGVPVLLIDPNGDEEVSRNLARIAELVAGAPRPQTAGARGASLLKGKAPLGGLAFWRGASR